MEPVRAVPPPSGPTPRAPRARRRPPSSARLLRAAGYEAQRIQERLATGDQLLARSPELPAYLRRLGDADELAVLLRLFLLGVPVTRAAARRSSSARELRARLAGAGLLVDDGEAVHGAARLVPHDELLIASDHAAADEEHADHVPGVHRPSVALAHLTVRGDGERALDVCTGNGIQAILLAAHAEHVVATDVNPRALAYAAFNAALNGVGNVETRHGSFFEPVEGERFDLVVANPPYVVSPESALPVPRQRHARRRRLRARRPRGARRARAGRVRLDPDRLGARPGRPDGAAAQLAGGLRLRRVPAPHLDRRPDRDRDAVEPRPRSTGRRRTPTRSTAGSPTTASSGSSSSATRASSCASAPTAATAGSRRSSCRAPRSARPDAHVRRLFETHDRLAESIDDALLDRRLRVVDDAVVTQEIALRRRPLAVARA